MAKEIKTLTVKPNEDAQTIQNLQCFGWKLLSSQEVYNKDSHLEVWGKNTYSVTQTMHYVKLTFERDSSKIANYSQIRRIEEAYMSIPYPQKSIWLKLEKEEIKRRQILVFGILGFFCVFSILMGSLAGEIGKGLLMSAFIAGFAYLLTNFINKQVEKYERAVSMCWKKRNRIAQQAEKYL